MGAIADRMPAIFAADKLRTGQEAAGEDGDSAGAGRTALSVARGTVWYGGSAFKWQSGGHFPRPGNAFGPLVK